MNGNAMVPKDIAAAIGVMLQPYARGSLDLARVMRTIDSCLNPKQDAPCEAKPVRALTVKEVASRLACSRRHVFRLLAQGKLPKIRIGRRGARVPEAAIDALVLAGKWAV